MQRTLARSLQASTSRCAPGPSTARDKTRRLSYNETLQPLFDLTAIMKDSPKIQDGGTFHHLALEQERERRHYARLVAFQLPELAKRLLLCRLFDLQAECGSL